jgi:hypothetical protein
MAVPCHPPILNFHLSPSAPPLRNHAAPVSTYRSRLQSPCPRNGSSELFVVSIHSSLLWPLILIGCVCIISRLHRVADYLQAPILTISLVRDGWVMPLSSSLFPEIRATPSLSARQARSLFTSYPAPTIQFNQQLDGSISGRDVMIAWLQSPPGSRAPTIPRQSNHDG